MHRRRVALSRLAPSALALSLLLVAGCPTGTGSAAGGDLADLATLQGEWIRFDSNNPDAIGMTLQVTDDEATVLDPADTSVSAGDIKWRAITPIGPTTFEHEELGSSGDYFPATIGVLDNGNLEVLVEAAGAGNEQSWEPTTGDGAGDGGS